MSNEGKDTKYWVAVASKDHVAAGVAGGFAQANHGKKSPMARMRRGDKIIYYSSKNEFGKPPPCQAFTAIGEVSDDQPYQGEMRDNNFVPHRRDVVYYPSQEVPIRPLIEQLQFITNKQKWGFMFRQGFFEISREDYYLVANAMTNAKG